MLLLVVALSSCGRGSRSAGAPIAAAALRGANVLLVTIDTLRADHVGAYGSPLGLTPTIDRFARQGLRFDIAHAHVPMTLPSHTTIMTGLYPAANGVHDNGSFRFDGAKPTLAGELKRAGYRTGAFVSAFVLDARFGLNAGFDVYDDRVQGTSANLEVVQRTAEHLRPRDYDLLFNLGMLLADGDTPADAIPYLQRFLREAPRDQYARDIAQVRAIVDRLERHAR